MDEKDFILLEFLMQFDKPIGRYDFKKSDTIKANFLLTGTKKHESPDSIIVRLHDLKQRGLVQEKYVNQWSILPAGSNALEQYKKEKAEKNKPMRYLSITGNNNVVGNTQSSFDKSFNADHSNKNDIKKSRITVESILKVSAAIITVVLAVLKGCGII